MDPRLGFHRRFLSNRQGLSGILGSIFPASGGSGSASTSGNQQAGTSGGSSSSDTNPLDPDGVIGGISSLLDGISTTTTSSSPAASSTTSSSRSTGSTTTSPASSTRPFASASTSPSVSSSTTSAAATSTTATPSADVVYTTSDGTSIVYVTTSIPSTASASASATVSPSPTFLHNPSLEGGVFAVVGIIAVAIICSLVTWTIRKRQRNRLERDMAVAVDFDPGAADRYEQENSVDKHRLSSSSGHGYGYGYGVRPAYAAPQPEYYPPMGYGQYPMAAYPEAPPNQDPYQGQASSGVPQPAAHGGANLTRKFSDRKPVPPLIPTPAYDPTNTHVSIPPQFYQQEGYRAA